MEVNFHFNYIWAEFLRKSRIGRVKSVLTCENKNFNKRKPIVLKLAHQPKKTRTMAQSMSQDKWSEKTFFSEETTF